MFIDRKLSGVKRAFDPLAATILILALMTAAYQLVVTDWIDSLYILLTITLLGVVLGFFLGYSWFKRFPVILFSILYGLIIVTWQLAFSKEAESLWLTRLNQIGSDLHLAIIHLVENEPVDSPLFFLTLMSILFWILSVFAGYSLVRNRKPWLTILPMGVVTLLVYIYGSATSLSANYLATYLFLGLILVSRIFIIGRESQWTQSQVQVPDLVRFDFLRVILLITFLLVLFAWQFPIFIDSLPTFQQAWSKLTRSWEEVDVYFENAFAALKPSAQLIGGYYDNTHDLGRGNSRSEDVFFVANVPQRPSSGVRFFWKARSYDNYMNGVWQNSQTETVLSPSNGVDFNVPVYSGRWVADVEIITKELISTLYLPVEAISVSRPNKVVATFNPDGKLDIVAVHADPQLRAESTYQIQSALANFTIEELRQAGTDYPSWVTERYLQLPATLPTRVVELAKFITEGQENPHDQAAAITIWLRENIGYSAAVPPAPETQDLVDWFLFDLRRGFCNYYSTAEVILLRAAGIPARISFGYAQGEKSTEPLNGFGEPSGGREFYLVREKDAHSWPEVYFPTYGWVEFEPTVSQSPIVRPVTRTTTQAEMETDPLDTSIGDPEFEEAFDKRAFLLEREFERLRSQSTGTDLESSEKIDLPYQFLVIATLVVVLFGLWRARRKGRVPPAVVWMETGIQRLGFSTPVFLQRWAHQASLKPIERAFHEVNLALKRVGFPAHPADTPLERANRLIHCLPEATDSILQLTMAYQASVYSPNLADWVLMMPKMRNIRRLSYLAYFRRIFKIKKQK